MNAHRALLARVTEADIRLLRVFMAIVDANGLTAAELAPNRRRAWPAGEDPTA